MSRDLPTRVTPPDQVGPVTAAEVRAAVAAALALPPRDVLAHLAAANERLGLAPMTIERTIARVVAARRAAAN